MVVPELPKTRSGKIMRRLLRDVAENRELGDVTTLADSTVMDLIRRACRGRLRRGLTRRVGGREHHNVERRHGVMWKRSRCPRRSAPRTAETGDRRVRRP